MAEFKITAPDGRTFNVTAPEGATREQALAYAQEHMPAASGPQAPLGPFKYQGMSDPVASPSAYDPKADPFAQHTMAQDLKRNIGTSPAVPIAAVATGGALAPALGAPALAGKMVAGAAYGAEQAREAGGGAGKMTAHALIDAALVALTEGGANAAKSVLEGGLGKTAAKMGLGFGRAAKGFEAGTEKLKDALQAVQGRVAQYATLNIPSLSKVPMSLADAFEKLLGARGATFKQALKEFKSELNTIDLQSTPKPGAGQVFMDRAPKYRAEPSSWSKFVHSITPAVTGEVARDVAMGQAITPSHGVPLGAVETLAIGDMMGSGFGGLARHVLPHMVAP